MSEIMLVPGKGPIPTEYWMESRTSGVEFESFNDITCTYEDGVFIICICAPDYEDGGNSPTLMMNYTEQLGEHRKITALSRGHWRPLSRPPIAQPNAQQHGTGGRARTLGPSWYMSTVN